MTRRLVVHVGTAKAGSTSIQAMLDARADVLRACGIHVLSSLSRGSGLHPGAWLVRELAEAPGDEGRGRAWRWLAGQIRRSKAERFVLSVETFTSRGIRVRCAERLQELAAGERLAIDIVGYVRPQWQRLESGYSQRVKAGFVGIPFGQFVARRLAAVDGGSLDYNQVFGAFRAAFGAGHVKVLPLEPSRLPQGLLAHFLETIGADGGIRTAGLPRTNLRLGAKELEVRRLVRARTGARVLGGERLPNRLAWLSALFDDDAPFAGFGLAEIRAVEGRFAAANARFARDYGIDPAGILFRDPVPTEPARPNTAQWDAMGRPERRRVRRYVLDRTGVDLEADATLPIARWRVRTRIAWRWLARTAAEPSLWREYVAFPDGPTRRYWQRLWRQGWRR